MATLTQAGAASRNLGALVAEWARENIWSSPVRLAFNLVLAWLALLIFLNQLSVAPGLAVIAGAAWLFGLLWIIASVIFHRRHPVSEWLKERLYNSATSALITLNGVLLLAGLALSLFSWAILNASFSSDPATAKASGHTGATWGVIFANFKLFMVGQVAGAQLWRVWAALGLVFGLAIISVPVYVYYRAAFKPLRKIVTVIWLISPIILFALLRGLGRSGPLAVIDTRTWGGLLLTLILTVFASAVSFPLGVLLALGRRSAIPGIPAWLTYTVVGLITIWGLVTYTLPNLPLAKSPLEYVLIAWPLYLLAAGIAFQLVYKGNVVAAFSTIYIEVIRGVPLITVLFMANLMLPLFLPSNITIENAFRAMWAFMFFSAAYLAENVRGGLQSIFKGQYEAASALGLNIFQQYWFIILPQALRVVIPPLVGHFMGLFKDTSLVAIVGLLDLLNIANAAAAQPDWLGLRREVYFFVSVIYFFGCLAMALAGRWLERRLRVGQQ